MWQRNAKWLLGFLPQLSFGRLLILVRSFMESCWISLTSEEIREENTNALQATLVEVTHQRCSLMCNVRTKTLHHHSLFVLTRLSDVCCSMFSVRYIYLFSVAAVRLFIYFFILYLIVLLVVRVGFFLGCKFFVHCIVGCVIWKSPPQSKGSIDKNYIRRLSKSDIFWMGPKKDSMEHICLCLTLVTRRRNIFLYLFTELKTYHLSFFYLQTLRFRHCWS